VHLAIEAIGWAGALLILSAYALLSASKIAAHSRTYQWLNVAGAAGFVINSGWNGAYPSAALNVIWIGIGLWALMRVKASKQAAAEFDRHDAGRPRD
jgi:hypothetical protein